jgi:hypothetical protein
MALPYLSDVVMDGSFPLSGLTTAALAFNALSGRLAWVEFDAGFISEHGSQIVDRGTGEAYAITGTLGADTNTSGGGTVRGGATFDGTQIVNLGSIFPTSADYSLFAIYKQSSDVTQAVHGILGSSGASYHSFHLSQTSGRLNVSHAATGIQNNTVDHTPGTIYRAGVTWLQSTKALAVYFGGSAETSTTETVSNTDATAIIGDIPGLAGSRGFYGTLFHVSLFNRQLTEADLAAVNTYLAEQYV